MSKRSFLIYIIPVIAILLSSCRNLNEELERQAVQMVRKGYDITQEEYKDLEGFIKSNPEDLAEFVKEDGSLNNTALEEFLNKIVSLRFKDRDVTIWLPGNNGTETSENISFNVNVYLENSQSMDGYVNNVPEFRNAIYNLLGDLKISEVIDSLNLYYINNSIVPLKDNALPADIADFINKLSPDSFRAKGGNKAASDLKDIITKVLGQVDTKNAVILVSDYVFSPGKASGSATDYLEAQSVGIRMDFVQKLKQTDISVLILHLEAPFEGDYFNKYDTKINLREASINRPYYVWILGTDEQVQSIISNNIVKNIRGEILNKAYFTSHRDTRIPNYKVQKNPKIGTFELDKSDFKKSIIDAEKEKRDKNKDLFGFTVAVDFSDYKIDEKYFEDPINYEISNSSYTIKITANTDRSSPALNNFTHLLHLSTYDLKSEELTIQVLPKTPKWVYTVTSYDDTGIKTDKSEHSKTFGFKYLINGVAGAYGYQLDNNYGDSSTPKAISEIKIKIKK
ncbi:hypothetical protein [uncultured Pontibacter sp.]|uniref:hypothetical protein n=1 Tax=uncultured Pontibacter sp. TaxID=453356 RepID=UPI00261C8523|nr:hypothetical protein [uncultured Pontibacter sp.]